MRDFISFYQKRKGLGIDGLLASCGIGRSMFYRFLKEPFRFSDDQLELISGALEISGKEKAKLLSFKSDYRPTDSISSDVEAEILGILFSNPYEFRANKNDFEYYDFDKKRTYILDADGLVDSISEHIAQTKQHDGNRFECYLSIYNCITVQKVSTLYGLLSGIQNKLGKKFKTFRIIHYVDYQQDDLLSKLKMLKVQLPLYSTFNDYHLINTDLTEHPWAGRVDFFAIKYGRQTASGTSDWRYIVGNIERPRRTYVYSTDNYPLYKFLTCGIDEQSAGFEFDASPLGISTFCQNLLSTTRRVLISPEPCFDSIIPTIWNSLLERVKKSPNLKKIRNILDSAGAGAIYSDAQVLDHCINSLTSRFEINEKNESINILTTDGLEAFTSQKMTTEALVLGETFTRDEVLLQLEYIKSRLGDMSASGQQSFYIFDAKFRQPMYQHAILKNMLIYSLSPKNQNPLTSITTLKDKAIADALYNFVIHDVIDKREYGADSLLMPDSEASAFLDMLISRI